MTVEVIPKEVGFHTLEVKTRSDDQGREYLTWDYGSATYFVIIKLGVSFDLRNVNSPEFFNLLKNGLEKTFNSAGIPREGEVEFDADKRLSVISLNQFIRTNRYYYDPTPMKVVVLCIERRDDMIRVHVPEDPAMSATYVPAKVNVVVSRLQKAEKKGGLFGWRKVEPAASRETYLVKITNLSQLYTSGLYYTVKGSVASYPITQEMSGKQFQISVLPGKTVDFHVDNDHLQDYVLNVVRK